MWLSNKLGSLWAWPHTWLFGTWPHKNWGSGTSDTDYVWRKVTGLHGEADNRGRRRHAWLRLYSIETNRNNEDTLDMYSHIQTSKTRGAQEVIQLLAIIHSHTTQYPLCTATDRKWRNQPINGFACHASTSGVFWSKFSLNRTLTSGKDCPCCGMPIWFLRRFVTRIVHMFVSVMQ